MLAGCHLVLSDIPPHRDLVDFYGGLIVSGDESFDIVALKIDATLSRGFQGNVELQMGKFCAQREMICLELIQKLSLC